MITGEVRVKRHRVVQMIAWGMIFGSALPVVIFALVILARAVISGVIPMLALAAYLAEIYTLRRLKGDLRSE